MPEFPQPAANSSQDGYIPLTTIPLQYNGVGEYWREGWGLGTSAFIMYFKLENNLAMDCFPHSSSLGVQDCSILGPVQYYDDSCGLIPIPQTDLIAVSGNQYVHMQCSIERLTVTFICLFPAE